MARGGFNNALAGGSIDDFLRQLRGQAGQAGGPPKPFGVPHPPGYPVPDGGVGGGVTGGDGGPGTGGGPPPDILPPPPGQDGGSGGPPPPPPSPGGHRTAGTNPTPGNMSGPMTGPVSTSRMGGGVSGGPVNVMPYKDAPPPPAGSGGGQNTPAPDKEPAPGTDEAFEKLGNTGVNAGWEANKKAMGGRSSNNRQGSGLSKMQGQQQNQNQPPPGGNQDQPPPSGQQDDPPVVVEKDPPAGGQPNPAVSNWENFAQSNPHMQWMRDKGMNAMQMATWNAANSTDQGIRSAAQAYLDAMAGGGGGGGQEPPPQGQEEPPPTAQDQPNPAVSSWENFVQTNPDVAWLSHLPPDRAAAHFLRQANTPPEIRQAAQAYMDAMGRGGETPGTGVEAQQQRQIAQVRGALPGWILERMSAQDALNFAMKNPQSKIAGMLREAGVLQ